MPEGILQYKLPDEQREFDIAIQGQAWKATVWSIDNYLRNVLKYENRFSPEVTEALENVRKALRDELEERGLALW